MTASIIIRSKNEQKWLSVVLEKISSQSFSDFEVILVDSGSNDNTVNIAEKYRSKIDLKIFKIPPEEFNYPFACNYGAQKASGKYLVYLSAHSVPIGKDWLRGGLVDFDNQKIAGVYGGCRALPDASFWEKIWYGWGNIFKAKKREIKKLQMGILGNTNAIIRKDLWQKYNFNLDFASGGEDGDWARHFLKLGYKIIYEPDFSVYHSHGLRLVPFVKQIYHWHKIAQKFKQQ